jgi:hypothetical protein
LRQRIAAMSQRLATGQAAKKTAADRDGAHAPARSVRERNSACASIASFLYS